MDDSEDDKPRKKAPAKGKPATNGKGKPGKPGRR
jgi:hypothetical protein